MGAAGLGAAGVGAGTGLGAADLLLLIYISLKFEIVFSNSFISFVSFIISPLIILIRLLKKKENPKRFKEKLGFFTKNRSKGKLIWFHGASVGEFQSIVPLLEKLEKLEQLRALENGWTIHVAVTPHDSIGVDVPADVRRAARMLARTPYA